MGTRTAGEQTAGEQTAGEQTAGEQTAGEQTAGEQLSGTTVTKTDSSDPVSDLIAICRLFAVVEKEQVCCGTVTVAQCVVLQSLLRGPSEAALLASEHGVSRSAMTRLLDGLERKAWVLRTRDRADRRHVRVHLSESGQQEAQRLRQLTQHSLQTVLTHLPKGKRNQVQESIHLIRTALEKCRHELNCC